MARLFWAVLLIAAVVVPSVAGAGSSSFVETSEAILTELTNQNEVGPTRSFVVVEEKTRAITVRTRRQGETQDKEVVVTENSPAGVARLKVEFDIDSSRLRLESYEILDQLAVALGDVRIAGRQVCIKGHTDSDGSERHNLGLSYDRAEAVRDYVVARHNLTGADLFVVGYGEQLPLAANDSAGHKQLNRRVEITLGCEEVY